MVRVTTRVLTALAVGISLSAFGPSPTALGGGSGWLDDFDDAVVKARKDAMPILVEFSESETSEDSQALQKEALKQSDFTKWAKKSVVLLNIDFPEKKFQNPKEKEKNAALKERFQVKDFPTLIVLDSAGEEVGRLGYEQGSAKDLIARLEPIVEKASGAGQWLTDFEEAKKLSRATKRPILADFTGTDWCSWCIKLHDEVWDTPEFRKWAAKNVILLELDFPRQKEQSPELKEQNQKLAKEYSVSGYPTVLFLDSKGKVLGRSGYKAGGPVAWTEDAEKQMK